MLILMQWLKPKEPALQVIKGTYLNKLRGTILTGTILGLDLIDSP